MSPEGWSWPPVLTGAALLIAAVAVILRIRANKGPTAEEIERRRRDRINRIGKIIDGAITEMVGDSVIFTYEVRGVVYTASQDISTIDHDGLLPVGPAGIKYDPRNPADSIVISEKWSGLRKKGAASELL